MAVSAALRAAITRAQNADQHSEPVFSPLRGLGRGRLTPIDLLGQSLSTIAPATGMVFIALWMITYSPGYVGLAAIAATTSAVFLVAFCITQFTRRLAAAGSLYSFVFQGSGIRATLTAGAALVLGYLGISVSVFSQAVPSLLDTIAIVGPDVRGTAATVITTVAIALAVAWIAVRGVRFATRAILVVEACSLILIVVVMLATHSDTTTAVALPNPSLSAVPFLAMLTVLSMAGFESSAFFGPEAKRPLISVTRTVLISPIICGVLFVFAAWAAMTGHGATIVGAYFEGTASGASAEVVLAVKIGMTCSWFASTLGCAQAGSRLLYSMGIERVLPAPLARVHRRFAPVRCGTCVRRGKCGGRIHLFGYGSRRFGILRRRGGDRVGLRLHAGGLCFVEVLAPNRGTHVADPDMHRVRERRRCRLLVYIVLDGAVHGMWALPIAALAVAVSGTVWSSLLRRARPESLLMVGAFDSVETADLLPGAGTLLIDGVGRRRLVPDRGTAEGDSPEHGR